MSYVVTEVCSSAHVQLVPWQRSLWTSGTKRKTNTTKHTSQSLQLGSALWHPDSQPGCLQLCLRPYTPLALSHLWVAFFFLIQHSLGCCKPWWFSRILTKLFLTVSACFLNVSMEELGVSCLSSRWAANNRNINTINWVAYRQQKCTPHSSGGQKSKIRVPA